MELDLAAANRVIEACIVEGRAVGRNFSIVVVDAAGTFISAQRMDGAAILTSQIAWGKAYGCAAFRRDGPQLAQMATNTAFVSSLIQMTGGRFVAALGASRLMDGEKVLGAVGVSGAAAEQDQQVGGGSARVPARPNAVSREP